MKKILLINNGYPSEKNKHYVSYIKSIKECLIASNFDVDLLVMSSAFSSLTGKIKCYLSYYYNLLTFKNYEGYDYVYINNFPHSFLPLVVHFNKINKVIIHWHGDDIESVGQFKRVFNKISYAFVPKKALHFSPSNYFAYNVSEKLGVDKEAIIVSPSGGVDVGVFKPLNSVKERHDIIVKIGFSSHLSAEKGLDLIIELLNNARNLQFNRKVVLEFHYIKYGADKERYSKVLKSIENTVEHSMMKKEDMPIFYNAIDVFVFPTKRESLGSVGLEAMSCGVPVLGTNDFAIKEYVIPGINGELFEKDDYQSFEDNLIICVNNLENYNPRETILKEYSKEAVVNKYKQILG
ncbi:glycosyltransferase family 4 protein [Bizionia paragorgiae]|uniref:Glycosyltransferase involved in cell wall bisynthesis n=1 Tax=Bizionia paragorgiae TaxID=283786 RepID=A0A1H3W1R9_BIZPA|nr:glycosyltransferase family 4 protein [Bizionia paragorgiae]SDZ80979.1 Glycosyltransferase involved in cell wall bisynthesis [Bizionia paragorgiae]